jgi:pentose-5-phosphate-3-epimerase
MGIICGEVQHSDHMMSSFARKSTFMSNTVTSEWIKKYSELLSDCHLATKESGREMERTSIDEVFFILSHRISHTARSKDHPI